MRVAGIDAAPGRWALVVLESGRFAGAYAAADLADLFARIPDVAAAAIDIPLSLPDSGVRAADIAARQELGIRASTLFVVPPAPAFRAATQAEATAIARSLGAPGVSAQVWALRKRIFEALPYAADERLVEAHPELSFARMAGAPLRAPKRTWNGLARRLQLLNSQGIAFPDEIDGPGGALPPADLVDAAAVAWSAHRYARGLAERYPAAGANGASRLGAIWA